MPLNVVALAVNATYVYLSWDPPLPDHRNGLIEVYHIAITETDTDEELQYISVYNNTLIEPLHPYYTYKFSVAAVTVDVGPFTSQVTLQMPEAGTIFLCPYSIALVMTSFFSYSSNRNFNQFISGNIIPKLSDSVLVTSRYTVLEWNIDWLHCCI